jgi:methyltransferase (TIGR00027 family)
VRAGEHSYMAEATARMRAAHQLLDDEPRILDDPLAVRILGAESLAAVKADEARYRSAVLARARAMVVVRARYVEDECHAALARGVRQVVILGAGLDTLAYRLAPQEDLRIFELDHPDTQRWKLERLAAGGIGRPDGVVHVPLDFGHDSLPERLIGAGFELGRPAFFSCLGVTYYLERRTVDDLLMFVATGAPDTQLVFDFLLDEPVRDPAARESMASAHEAAASHGEQFRSRFDPMLLRAELLGMGFSAVALFGPRDATQRYLGGRTDGLRVDSSLHLASATV